MKGEKVARTIEDEEPGNPDPLTPEEKVREALIDIAAGKTTLGQAVQAARAALAALQGEGDQGEAEAQIPPCRYPVCMEEPGTPDPLTPEEAETLLYAAASLFDSVERVDFIQGTNHRAHLLTAMPKLRALASTGRGTE